MDRRYGERRDTKCRFLSPEPLSFLIGLLNLRAEFPLRPGFLTGTSAVRYFPAPLLSHGHKRGQVFPRNPASHGHKRGLYFPRAPAFSREQARPVFSLVPLPSHGHKRGQRRERM